MEQNMKTWAKQCILLIYIGMKDRKKNASSPFESIVFCFFIMYIEDGIKI